MTTPDQLRAVVRYLQLRVRLADDGSRTIVFEPPTEAEMAAAGFDRETTRELLSAPWWTEMMDDVIETPDFAEPEESREVVLGYARDVVLEYIRKRFSIGV